MNEQQSYPPRHFKVTGAKNTSGHFANWRRAIGPVFDIAAGPTQIGSFEGELAAYATAEVMLSQTTSSRIRISRSPDTIGQSQLDHFAVRLVVNGETAGLAGRSEVDAQAGDIFFIDLLQTLDLAVSVRAASTSDVTLWIPRPRMLSSISDDHALHGLVLRHSSPAAALIGASLRALAERASRMTAREMNALASGVIELIAKALAPILESVAISGTAVPLASFVTVRRFIDRNLSSFDLDAEMVAKNFGLSRASLYRLFEPVGGIARYIRERRVDRAFQTITAAGVSNRRIGQVANGVGFKTLGAFNRAFRSSYGMSPLEAREKSLKGLSYVPLENDQKEGASLGHWLASVGRPLSAIS